MIPASKKVNFTEVPAGLTNQLSQTFSTDEEAEIPIKEEIQTVTKVAAAKGSKKNDRPGQINICIFVLINYKFCINRFMVHFFSSQICNRRNKH